mmetsp:Transcript_40717/g.49387  ORF Transcript_40717/g.49387 Transcript_40717/m.49387 type:complete len:610 (+) Transcript_40717:115-1944(+)
MSAPAITLLPLGEAYPNGRSTFVRKAENLAAALELAKTKQVLGPGLEPTTLIYNDGEVDDDDSWSLIPSNAYVYVSCRLRGNPLVLRGAEPAEASDADQELLGGGGSKEAASTDRVIAGQSCSGVGGNGLSRKHCDARTKPLTRGLQGLDIHTGGDKGGALGAQRGAAIAVRQEGDGQSTRRSLTQKFLVPSPAPSNAVTSTFERFGSSVRISDEEESQFPSIAWTGPDKTSSCPNKSQGVGTNHRFQTTFTSDLPEWMLHVEEERKKGNTEFVDLSVAMLNQTSRHESFHSVGHEVRGNPCTDALCRCGAMPHSEALPPRDLAVTPVPTAVRQAPAEADVSQPLMKMALTETPTTPTNRDIHGSFAELSSPNRDLGVPVMKKGAWNLGHTPEYITYAPPPDMLSEERTNVRAEGGFLFEEISDGGSLVSTLVVPDKRSRLPVAYRLGLPRDVRDFAFQGSNGKRYSAGTAEGKALCLAVASRILRKEETPTKVIDLWTSLLHGKMRAHKDQLEAVDAVMIGTLPPDVKMDKVDLLKKAHAESQAKAHHECGQKVLELLYPGHVETLRGAGMEYDEESDDEPLQRSHRRYRLPTHMYTNSSDCRVHWGR